MGWELHEYVSKRGLENRVTVGATLHRAGSNRSYISVVVRIGREIVDKMKLSTGQVALFWGTAGHKGWIRIDPDGPPRLSIKKTSAGVRASYSLIIGPRAAAPMPREDCEYHIVENALDIKMPDWVTPPALGALRSAHGREQQKRGPKPQHSKIQTPT